MVTPELLEYIRAEGARGIDKDAIMQALVSSGWLQQDVSDAFVALAAPQPPLATGVSPIISVPEVTLEPAMPVTAEPEAISVPVTTPASVAQSAPPVASIVQPAANLYAKAAKIEIAYDTAVEKVSELGGEQQKVVTDSVKKLEERKIDEIKKRLLPS